MSDDWQAGGFVNPPASWQEIAAELTAERDDAVRAHAAAVGARQIWESAAKRAEAEVAALTAERDGLRQERDSLAKSLDDAASHLADEEALRREMAADRDTLAAQLARAETVVDKAMAVLRVTGSDWADSPIEQLRAAVDVYQATPATTEERSND